MVTRKNFISSVVVVVVRRRRRRRRCRRCCCRRRRRRRRVVVCRVVVATVAYVDLRGATYRYCTLVPLVVDSNAVSGLVVACSLYLFVASLTPLSITSAVFEFAQHTSLLSYVCYTHMLE